MGEEARLSGALGTFSEIWFIFVKSFFNISITRYHLRCTLLNSGGLRVSNEP